MKKVILRLSVRLVVGALVFALHAVLGRYLADLDPIAELISGARVTTAALLLLFVSARAVVWFVLPAWWIAGILSDLLDARTQRASKERNPLGNSDQRSIR